MQIITLADQHIISQLSVDFVKAMLMLKYEAWANVPIKVVVKTSIKKIELQGTHLNLP